MNEEHDHRCGKIQVGDRGQRFEIRGKREQDGIEIPLGWATTAKAAEQMAGGFRQWPYLQAGSVWIKDRDAPPAPPA